MAMAGGVFLWAGSGGGVAFVKNEPQFDTRAMAGAAVMFFGALLGVQGNAAQAAESTYGTHELAVKQGAQKSSVWSSVRTPPATSNAVPPYLYVRPQDTVSLAPVVWKPPLSVRGPIFSLVSAGNPPTLTTVSSVWTSANAPLSAARVLPFVTAASQSDPTQVQPQVFVSQPAALIVSAARLLPMVQSAPQSDPTQIASSVWPSQLSISYAVKTRVTTAPQTDPSQVQPQIFVARPAAIAVSAQRLFPLVQTAPQRDPTQIAPRIWPSLRYVPYAVRTWITSRPQTDPSQVQSTLFRSGSPGPGILETIPYLIGAEEYSARIMLGSIYMLVSVVGSGGTVIAQSIDPFTQVARGTTVTITMGGPTYVPTRGRGQLPYNIN